MRRQHGMSFVSVLSLLAIAVFIAKTAFTLVPMYWDNKMLSTVLDRMKESGDIRSDTSPNKIKSLLEKRLYMNNLTLPYDELTIKKDKTGLVLDWPYETRANWFGDVDMIVRFHQHIEF